MSLYLLSKDTKLRSSINRQLKKPCLSATTMQYLGQLRSTMAKDRFPVLLIDEEFSKRGLPYLLHLIIKEQLPGKRILITSMCHVDYETGFAIDASFGILRRCSTIEQLIMCVIESAGFHAIHNHLTLPQIERYMAKDSSETLSSVLIGTSQNIANIRTVIEKVGRRFDCVHIEGETGTGKEVVANLLREKSGTPDPFIVINCSTIPEMLADSHLFGNEKGAFTDAKEATPGYVGKANGGVLFLDELEDMSPAIQGKLLRLLETHTYHKVGGNEERYSQFKLITASNIPLMELKDRQALRADLFYRLDRLVLSIAPLRERREDIPLLVDHFLKRMGESRRPDKVTMSRIMEYSWPGNARELMHELERLSVFASDDAFELSYKEILTESVLKQRIPHLA